MRSLPFAPLALVLLSGVLGAVEPISTREQPVLDAIHASDLKGYVSFLASDVLEGRDTPSKGLDVAAEFIAAHFRRIGLEPLTSGAYFQGAPYLKISKQPMDAFSLSLTAGGETKWTALASESRIYNPRAFEDSSVETVYLKLDDSTPVPPAQQLAGKAVFIDFGAARFAPWTAEKRREILAAVPAIVIEHSTFLMAQTLRPDELLPPLVRTNSDSLRKLFDVGFPAGARLSVKLQAPEQQKITLRNVVGVLPGSDPRLKDTYVLVTAHYDHVGISRNAQGDDKIFNGANDNASGTASMMAIAEAMAKSPLRPKRSLVFMAYFGEEHGLFGSRFYVKEPIFPLRNTIANLNLEQMGRTDDSEGSRVGQITASGFDYTSLGQLLTDAGSLTGVKAWKHDQNSDAFFSRSDNQALADAGVPAITLAVAWTFPDYHRPGDHWEKLDYANMQQVCRTVALTAWRAADSDQPVSWVDTNPKTLKYRQAYKKLQGN